MRKILVVFTGGTIGSVLMDRSIDVDATTAYELLRMYEALENRLDYRFDTLQPFTILSENLVPEDWKLLVNLLDSIDYTLYKGIIITHGTDTLPFTAAALSLVCKDIPIPIVLVASNYPLHDKRGKGVENFSHAVDFITDQALKGVFVIFENNRGEAVVHLGTRLTQSDPYTDEYDSTYSVPFGIMINRQLSVTAHELNPSLIRVQSRQAETKFTDQIAFSNEILYIAPQPGLNYRYYDFTAYKPRALLHDLYHSGTACTRASELFPSSLIEFLQYCKLHEVPVYIAPLKNASGDLYASSMELLEAGAIPLENISVEAAWVKLMLAYGCFENHSQARQFMLTTSLFYEVHGA